MSERRDVLRFTVPGKPVPKGRPRTTTRGGKPQTYTPRRTREHEEQVAKEFRAAHVGWRPDAEHAWAVEVTFCCKTLGADLDNLVKLVLDALNGLAFEDDRQVERIHAEMLRGHQSSHTAVTLWPLGALGERSEP